MRRAWPGLTDDTHMCWADGGWAGHTTAASQHHNSRVAGLESQQLQHQLQSKTILVEGPPHCMASVIALTNDI